MRRFMFLFVGAALILNPCVSFADTDSEIKELKTQVSQLMDRIDKLEKEKLTAKTTAQPISSEPSVDMSKLVSKLKIKGRLATGFYQTGSAGSYPSGSFEAPEMKIQLDFSPDEFNTVVARVNLNNAASNNPLTDYLYLDSKLSEAFGLPFKLDSRLGRMKVMFGEETLLNNQVESALVSNSAASVGGSDEGAQLSGAFDVLGQSLGWVTSVTNGTSGIGSDTGASKAFSAKLYYNITDPLYVSASYYNSGHLKSSNSDISIAGINSMPTGATNWNRQIYETDLRYDFGKGTKPLDPPVYSDSKAILRLAYGQFSDSATGAADRDGDYGFIEGTYNVTPKIYTAGRYSVVDLDGKTTASLNGVTAERYYRYSIGGGYRFTDNTIFKLAYDINREEGSSGTAVEDLDNNQLSAVITAQF